MEIELSIDPCDAFPAHATKESIVNACGIIATWATNAMNMYRLAGIDIGEYMINQYEYSMGGFKEVDHISANGIYSYPEDPVMYPLVEFSLNDDPKVKIWIYPGSWVAYTADGGETIFSTRMD